MAENKQEPRQLKKPGHKDGQTDSEGVRGVSARETVSETERGQTGSSQMADGSTL